ncbi:MAG TPA: FAD-binding protein [Kiloniellales bacterium]
MSILVVAEHDNAELKPATLHTLGAAEQLAGHGGGEIHLLVAGAGCGAVAEAAAKIPCVAKVLLSDSAEYEHRIAENMAPLIVKLAPNYGHVLAAATTSGKNVMPRAAAQLDVQQVSDISAIESADTFVRPIYAGNALATVRSSDAVKLITVRGTAFEAVAAEGGSAPVEQVAATGDQGLSSFVGAALTETARPELTSARIVISGGRGMQAGDNFAMLEQIADKLGAAVGASRAAVDAGFVPNDYQVGQTGKVVAPDLYIAVGISGAIQHLAGMKDSKVIVAINKDEEAPIFQVADYGLVADLFQALPELEAAL